MIEPLMMPEGAKLTPFDVTKYPFDGIFGDKDNVYLICNNTLTYIARIYFDKIFKGFTKTEKPVEGVVVTNTIGYSNTISENTLLKAIAIAQDPKLAKELLNV